MGFVVETGSNAVHTMIDKIPEGNHADVTDGHLSIYDDDEHVVALYAPEKWRRAFEDDHVTPAHHREGVFSSSDEPTEQ